MLGLVKVQKIFYGNLNFLARFLTLNMKFIKSFFNILRSKEFFCVYTRLLQNCG